MIIISFLNAGLSVVLAYVLFELVGVTINQKLTKYSHVALSILDGVIIATIKLFALPQAGMVSIILVVFGCSAVVLFYPKKGQSFIILEAVVVAYILLGWGVSYLSQLLFFGLFSLTAFSYFVFGLVKYLVLLIMSGIIMILFKINYKKKEIVDFVYDITLELAGRRVNLKMFLDSGNSLYDHDASGLPIFVVSKQNLENKLNLEIVEDLCRKIEYTTLNGCVSELAIIEPDNIYIKKGETTQKVSALVGVVEKDFKLYDGLLHSAVC